MAKKNEKLGAAKSAKNDEFYTQYIDIAKEMQAYIDYNPDVFRGKTILLPCDDPEWSNFTKYFSQNFEQFGIKKLISTSFASGSKSYKTDWQPTLFETENPIFNADKTDVCGKIFILERDVNGDNRIDMNDLEWQYLEGTGDFRSDEVTRLRDEADMIITNPPFSLFREFLSWIMEGNKQCVIIGNLNAIHYKEVFPLIRDNKLWLGPSISSGDRAFEMPAAIVDPEKFTGETKVDSEGKVHYFQRVMGVRWYSNIEHGRRHQAIQLMPMKDNLKYSKHKDIKQFGYLRYDNYDALDVPFCDAIPSDFDGVMGVPDSFLDKYCPEQFEIISLSTGDSAKELGIGKNYRGRTDIQYTKNGVPQCPYSRILIRKKQ